jgi:hypothetical protein
VPTHSDFASESSVTQALEHHSCRFAAKGRLRQARDLPTRFLLTIPNTKVRFITTNQGPSSLVGKRLLNSLGMLCEPVFLGGVRNANRPTHASSCRSVTTLPELVKLCTAELVSRAKLRDGVDGPIAQDKRPALFLHNPSEMNLHCRHSTAKHSPAASSVHSFGILQGS